jgi:peptide/nickel transport system ATP-binding protein
VTAPLADVPGAPVVEVDDLRVQFGYGAAAVTVVDGISFSVGPGECLALVGESGSGKSVTARTLVGLTGDRSTVRAGALRLGGHDVTTFSEARWRRVRGAEVGFVMQDALASLDSLRPVGREIAEPLRLHTELNRAQRQEKVVELLASVGVPEPEMRARQHPYELSGGLRQRALIASAIACSPRLLILDEPTTALDATIAAQVLRLLETLKSGDAGMLIVSHDLAVVARLADRVAVMQAGVLVEHGPTAQVLGEPEHGYTRLLLAAVPSAHSRGTRLSVEDPGSVRRVLSRADGISSRPADPDQGPVIEAEGLVKSYRGPDGHDRTVVSDVSFTLAAGECLGIVGESGSGKTTTARLVLGVESLDAGTVRWRGRDWAALSPAERREERRHVQVVYQDPLSSFDPRYTVERVIGEALGVAGHPRAARRERAAELLELARLDPVVLGRRPLELSGGQRQRVAIARALASDPEVIVCDEPVSALDVSVQARILDLLADLQSELGLAYLFISHDLGVIHHLCDRVLVMKDGAVVESGEVGDVFDHPRHEYTRALLAAIPRLDRATRTTSGKA